MLGSQVRWSAACRRRRGGDSNPRGFRQPLFESGTINHSDTSPPSSLAGEMSLQERDDLRPRVLRVVGTVDVLPLLVEERVVGVGVDHLLERNARGLQVRFEVT